MPFAAKFNPKTQAAKSNSNLEGVNNPPSCELAFYIFGIYRSSICDCLCRRSELPVLRPTARFFSCA